eukprot:1827567-Prymnesium_polylepis.1
MTAYNCFRCGVPGEDEHDSSSRTPSVQHIIKWYQSRTVKSKLGAPTLHHEPKAAKKAAAPDQSQPSSSQLSGRSAAETCRPRQYIDRGRRRRRKN